MRVSGFHIQQIGIPERDERQNGARTILEEVIVEDFPKLIENMYSNIKNVHQFPNRKAFKTTATEHPATLQMNVEHPWQGSS